MTNNQLTDAQISNATLIRLIRWADEHKSHYVAAALRELQERRKADSEPVALQYRVSAGTATGWSLWHDGKGEQYENSYKVERRPLYLHAQPAPVVSADLLCTAASAIEDLLEHTDPNTSYYSGVWADVPGKLRSAMLNGGKS
ncbi:TPA: hypothetical protein ACNU87_002563 [Klebsiella variicola]